MRRPTILQIVPTLETGGAERTAIDVAAAVVAKGGRALVASQGGRMVPELVAAGGEPIDFPAATKNPLAMIANIGRLAALAKAEGVDLIHARSRAPAWVALGAARRLGVPFVTTYHGAYKERSRFKNLYNSVMARGDVVIANSEWTGRLVAERHPFAKGRIVAIARGSDLTGLRPESVGPERIAALRAAWALPAGARVVLQVARLTGWKGQRVLIEALARLDRAGHKDLVAVLAGDAQGRDDYAAALKAQAAAAGLGDRVLLVGHCSDVPAALRLADVVAVASTEPEAFGRAAVEAQAAGVPLVATDLGAVSETVLAPPEVAEDARTGWRVPPNDADALAGAIAAALALSAEARAALAARAWTHVASRFSLAQMTDATLHIYDTLLKSRGAGF
ncbi:glycosyltransferase family 4 protein [Segnochrobactrum spirostomi]|uniref:Glycosyltransferase family 4 protein n=1 Tax=Segnochrobactrum spirostomi TaxID=2608987 RepID=A0A6A7Y478_9HYPH|nr:glycosyltransferase family 4 protein [Segnochrobactrum spirostomi]MQT12921.1 glycosyltransferase family 4 protein [Segnochrobactrum spirostomi]